MGRGAITQGQSEPLGASLTGTGVNFAVWSAHATAIEVCLFEGETEVARIPLPGRTGPVFHGHVAGLTAGARYGLRAHGPFDPAKGHRFNPNKLLVDPYALALDRPFDLDASMFGYRPDTRAQTRQETSEETPATSAPAPHEADAAFDLTDSAHATPKAVVVAPQAAALASQIPWRDTVIYELHVRGFTKTHPDIPEDLRGTFAGLAHPAAVAHLKALGVTAVELLPCAAWIDERHLGPLQLTNYWGYNPISMMAPDPRLAPGGWPEVRAAVEALAAAGIETLVDVVFNHTGEGDALGPTVSFRGLDNASYYRLDPADPAAYVNDAGTGNILALDNPAALRLTTDALRAWRRYGGVAGFRFDLATVLGRRAGGFDPAAPLLSAIAQDPELRDLKLIAEPWDCGPGGYQLGGFPPAWAEWNDRYRDALRGFWRGDAASLGGLAARLAGSQDLFFGRRPSRSVNFIVAHDGFTLADLVAYEAKHNEANGEGNRDGTTHNASWNNGVEGPTDDPAIAAARLSDQRALLASLILSRGTPMLVMGAELGHGQQGNNNAYAQDNALGWLDWARADPDLAAFTGRLIALRRKHPALHADHFLTGEAGATPYPDVVWRRPDGEPLADADWDDPAGQTLVMLLAEPTGDGLDRVMLVIHRGSEPTKANLPEPRDGLAWTLAADSADETRQGPADGPIVPVAPRSVLLLVEAPAPRRKRVDADPEALGKLAAAAGISPDWWSLDGQRHAVSPDTQRALLAALRLPADTSQQALATLHDLAQARDHRPLPAVLVQRADRPMRIPLRLEPGAPPPHTWLIITGDDGETHRLRADPLSCEIALVRGRDGRSVRTLVCPLPPLPAGRYLVGREDRPDDPCCLIVAPPTSFSPAAVAQGRRRIGASAQLYAVRRDGDQGLGDFTTLGALGEAAAAHGCAVLGLNPLHILFPGERERASPYYPSDRRFLDPIYLDLAKVLGVGPIPAAVVGDLVALTSIDYPGVWALKAGALEAAFAHGRHDARLDAFIAAGGATLAAFATFQAIAEQRPGEPWSQWPAILRDPATAAADPQRVRFHQYLQWLCENQFEAAARQASGLDIGLCRDLAIGAAPDGAEAWALSGLSAPGISIGAPPDYFAPQGQVWGLPPLDPLRLDAGGYRAHADLFAANMRHAGALRIDHVMGLDRQFWVPDGAPGSQGAYVAYPFEDLLGVLALESAKARCLVIGEDLGTVPHGLRETMGAEHILGYRVLPFERDGDLFRPPGAYPPLAWACVSTHDLPPLAGWWEGLDIAERRDLGLSSAQDAETELQTREAEKKTLVAMLVERGLVGAEAGEAETFTPDLSAALHAFIAATPSALAIVQVEDLAGERTAVNLPGTDRERPNWRRRLHAPLETLFDSDLARAILAAMQSERPTR